MKMLMIRSELAVIIVGFDVTLSRRRSQDFPCGGALSIFLKVAYFCSHRRQYTG